MKDVSVLRTDFLKLRGLIEIFPGDEAGLRTLLGTLRKEIGRLEIEIARAYQKLEWEPASRFAYELVSVCANADCPDAIEAAADVHEALAHRSAQLPFKLNRLHFVTEKLRAALLVAMS
jgi:hypothetical protein